MKAVVFTLGCKVNECESDSLIAGLAERGYEVSDKLVPADLYVVNTCAVTAEAEKKSRQMESRIKKLNPNAKIIFTGCATQKNPQSFANKSDAYLVTGAFSKNKILFIPYPLYQRICVFLLFFKKKNRLKLLNKMTPDAMLIFQSRICNKQCRLCSVA